MIDNRKHNFKAEFKLEARTLNTVSFPSEAVLAHLININMLVFNNQIKKLDKNKMDARQQKYSH